jgi:hypothetical protein
LITRVARTSPRLARKFSERNCTQGKLTATRWRLEDTWSAASRQPCQWRRSTTMLGTASEGIGFAAVVFWAHCGMPNYLSLIGAWVGKSKGCSSVGACMICRSPNLPANITLGCGHDSNQRRLRSVFALESASSDRAGATSACVTGFGCRPSTRSSQHAPGPAGRRSKAAREGNRGRGAPLFAGAIGIWLAPAVQRRSCR